MLEGGKGIVYLTAIEENAIALFDPHSQKTMVVVQDKRLQWPDTMAWGPGGKLYVTTSQIHRMPKYHGGVSKQQGPYMVYRMKLR
jgi:sugar lactone lactonase YvrE